MGCDGSHAAPAHLDRAVGLADPTHHFDEELRPRHAADTTCSHLTLTRSVEIPAELVVDPSSKRFVKHSERREVAIRKVVTCTRNAKVERPAFAADDWSGTAVGRPVEVGMRAREHRPLSGKGRQVRLEGDPRDECDVVGNIE